MMDKMEPQTFRECLEYLWVEYRPTRRELIQLEQVDKDRIVCKPLPEVLQAAHGPWFLQTGKRFAKAELLRRVRIGFWHLFVQGIRLNYQRFFCRHLPKK